MSGTFGARQRRGGGVVGVVVFAIDAFCGWIEFDAIDSVFALLDFALNELVANLTSQMRVSIFETTSSTAAPCSCSNTFLAMHKGDRRRRLRHPGSFVFLDRYCTHDRWM